MISLSEEYGHSKYFKAIIGSILKNNKNKDAKNMKTSGWSNLIKSSKIGDLKEKTK